MDVSGGKGGHVKYTKSVSTSKLSLDVLGWKTEIDSIDQREVGRGCFKGAVCDILLYNSYVYASSLPSFRSL